MQADFIDKIRVQLEEEKHQAMDRIAQLKQQDPFSDPDRLTDNAAKDMEATEEDSHDRSAAMVDQLTQKVTDIDAALGRISDGSYGTCTNCGNPIEQERLAIMPTATLCLACEQQKVPTNS